jgi:hypothetical protein
MGRNHLEDWYESARNIKMYVKEIVCGGGLNSFAWELNPVPGLLCTR